ncbi:hypothetical protein [Sphingomicrobium aestuariivivum]|uniref:hypothetical protein n=1 Tax=Sphingomicrobium aestuariivivum TaxID=1582356 RepID=UPI001FD6621D|nr:hypothetical protein [Sphingomicrobium aestuariivivum]MCJ8191958.1 hypothetical protein [Sphingomicrobium aestuariivivum]
MAHVTVQIRQLAAEASWAALAHLFMRGGIVVAFMVFSHGMLVDDFAAANEFNLSLSYLSSMALAGISPVVVRQFARLKDASEGREAGATLLLLAFAALAGVGMGLILAPAGERASLPLIFALAITVVVLGAFPAAVLNGLRAFRSLALAAGLGAAFLLVAASLTNTLVEAVLGITGALGIKAVCEWAIALRRIKLTGRPVALPDLAAFKAVMGSIARVGGSAILTAGALFAMTKLMREGQSALDFSLFAIGMQWYAMGAFVAGNVTKSLFPRQVAVAECGIDHHAQRRLLFQGVVLGVTGALLVIASAFAARPLIALAYGEAGAGAIDVIPLFIAVSLVAIPGNMVGNLAMAYHEEGAWLISSLFGSATLLMALLILPVAGASLAAVSLVMSLIVQNAACLLLLLRKGLL